MALREVAAIFAPVRTARVVACSLVCLAACGAPQHARPATGAIAGLARDRASGDPIAKAEIRVRAEATAAQLVTASSDRGRYGVDHLAPGRYSLSAAFAGQPLEVVNIDVRAGEVTTVDLVFTLGRPDRIRVDFSGRGPSEVHRGSSNVDAAEAVVVPRWSETAR